MWIFLAWQLWPLYLLAATALLFPARFRKTRLVFLAGLGLVAIGVWVALPFPWLAQPDGPYGVGTRTERWVDPSRPELATSDSTDHRTVILQIFYPVKAGTRGTTSVYMDGLHNLPPSVSVMPGFMLARFGHADTHSIVNAPLSTDKDQWPVILFSPGYGAPRSFYTSLITRLASRGFVVCAIDHPYEAGIAELTDGRVVSTVIPELPNGSNRIGYMIQQQDLRVADIGFALAQLTKLPLAKKLDLEHIAAVGHSFGGASSMAAMSGDPRITAAVNIDGTPYGTLPEKRLTHPVLWLQSDLGQGKFSDAYLNGNQRILERLEGARGSRYMLRNVHHFGFTDFPLFLSPPGRWLASLVLGGSRGPGETHGATVDLVTDFLRNPVHLETTAARYPWIAGGFVAPGKE